MSNIITWLNNNQGFVMSILTGVYVIATIIIVIYNMKAINEMKKGREEENRPYIFAHLHKDPRDLCFYLRVKNYGKTGGKIVSLNISPQMKFNNDADPSIFLKNVILAPNQQIQFILLEQKHETASKKYTIDIEYISTSEITNKYTESYCLIPQYSDQMGYTDNSKSGHSNLENSINRIANYLDSIRQNI